MKYSFVLLIQVILYQAIYCQISLEPEYLIIGKDSLPSETEVVTDEFMFYNLYNSALRGGKLFMNDHWAPSNVGDNSLGWGLNVIAKGSTSIALGFGSEVYGYNGSVALGCSTKVYGINGSLAAGYYTTVHGNKGAVSFGDHTIANGNSVTVVGMFNDTIVSKGKSVIETSPLFIVGNGEGGSGNESNAMVVRKDGRVGIGTNTPSGLIHIEGDSTTELVLRDLGATVNIKLETIGQDNDVWEIQAKATPNTTPLDRATIIFKYGQDSIFRLRGNGNLNLAGSLSENSDSRLKTNIVPITNVLPSLLKLNAYSYDWKGSSQDQQSEIGLMAQEVYEQFPNLVQHDAKGMLSVRYTRLVPLLLEGLKEQQTRIDKLEKLINKMCSNK